MRSRRRRPERVGGGGSCGGLLVKRGEGGEEAKCLYPYYFLGYL